jgi:cytochrome c
MRARIVWSVLCACAFACGGRLGEVRDALSPEQRAQFDAGASAATPCWSCHDFVSPNNKVGPHLVGVIGRRAGSVPHFGYSDAMRRSGVTWDRTSLSRFLADPSGSVPGTSMLSPGVADPETLAALVFFIEKATAPEPGSSRTP